MGHDVICVDNDERKVAALQGGDTLIHENYLPELLDRYRNTRVRFTTDLAEATRECEAIFIAVGTPQSETGDADLSYVEAVACEIARSITELQGHRRKEHRPGLHQRVDPPRHRAQRRRPRAVRRRLQPRVPPRRHRRRRLPASRPHRRRRRQRARRRGAQRHLRPAHQRRVLQPAECHRRAAAAATAAHRCCITSTKSAEIIKHASNAFLALKISFINAVSNLCEATDANVEQVARGMGLDSRIGPKFLRPGIGYGGSCFPKDVAAFRSVAEQLGIDFNLLTEVEKINVQQKKRFLAKVRSALWTLRGKRLAVLGLAFKGETDDIRESPAIELVEMLLAEGCSIAAYDPAAMERTAERLPAGPPAALCRATAYAAAEDADALLILTDWAEFATLDLERLNTTLRYPIVIDGRNLYDPQVDGCSTASPTSASAVPPPILAPRRHSSCLIHVSSSTPAAVEICCDARRPATSSRAASQGVKRCLKTILVTGAAGFLGSHLMRRSARRRPHRHRRR